MDISCTDLAGNARMTRNFAVTALVLQGGGALGSYQAGVYDGLARADIHPNWVAGISIGALHAALIADVASLGRAYLPR